MFIENVIGYTRVSTLTQVKGHSLSYQKEAIEKFCTLNNLNLVKLYSDEGYSGVKDRPSFNKAMNRVLEEEEIKGIVFFSVYRFGRSATDIKTNLYKIKGANKKFYSVKENIDLETANGRLVFGILCEFAQFERDLIIERMQLGKEHAKIHGTKSGKPMCRPKAEIDWERVKMLRSYGLSWTKTAKEIGVSTPTLIRRAKEKGLK